MIGSRKASLAIEGTNIVSGMVMDTDLAVASAAYLNRRLHTTRFVVTQASNANAVAQRGPARERNEHGQAEKAKA